MMIKKLALTAAVASALLSSSSYAEENMFYIKAEGGLNFLPASEVTDTTPDQRVTEKFKSSMGGTASVGVGYYVMENLRTELSIKYPFISEAKASEKDIKSTFKPSSMGVFLKGCFDVYDFEVGKISIGAGLGWAQVSAEGSYVDTDGQNIKYKLAKKNNIGFGAGTRVSYNVSDAVALEAGYEWTMYGKTKDLVEKDRITNKEVTTKSPSVQTHELVFGLRFAI